MCRDTTSVESESDHPGPGALSAFVDIHNPGGTSAVVLTCEHASNKVPDCFTRPLTDKRLLREHIAWDPGAMPLAEALSLRLNAPLVYSRVSRLVYDCNRPPESDSAIPVKSEMHDIPGNVNLDETERQSRIDEIYTPFHASVESVIAAKKASGNAPVLVTVHSFTPRYFNQLRHTEIGILHDRDSRMADLMLEAAAGVCALKVERNRPYGPEDGVTHTLIRHGLYHSLPNVMLEIRNDLLTTTLEIKTMADIIQKMLVHTLSRLRVAA